MGLQGVGHNLVTEQQHSEAPESSLPAFIIWHCSKKKVYEPESSLHQTLNLLAWLRVEQRVGCNLVTEQQPWLSWSLVFLLTYPDQEWACLMLMFCKKVFMFNRRAPLPSCEPSQLIAMPWATCWMSGPAFLCLGAFIFPDFYVMNI